MRLTAGFGLAAMLTLNGPALAQPVAPPAAPAQHPGGIPPGVGAQINGTELKSYCVYKSHAFSSGAGLCIGEGIQVVCSGGSWNRVSEKGCTKAEL